MTLNQLAQRVAALEQKVERLNQETSTNTQQPWWRKTSGRFANNPVFDEIVRLGREYRESLRPGRRKSKMAASKKRKAGSEP